MWLAESITASAYAAYGALVAPRADVAVVANQGTAQRTNRLVDLVNLRPATATPNLCAFRCSPAPRADRFTIKILERHLSSTQVFIPMSCPVRYLAIVCLGKDTPDLTTLKAFVVGRSVGISYHPGVWHHPMVALDTQTDFACLVWEDGTSKDCEVFQLPTPVELQIPGQ